MTKRLLVSYLTITAFVLLILEVPLGVTFQRSERNQLVSGLDSDARNFAAFAQDVLNRRHDTTPADDATGVGLARLQQQMNGYAARDSARVLIVNDVGERVADTSTTDRQTNYLTKDRPEFEHALNKLKPRSYSIERHSSQLKTTLIFVAVPVVTGDRLLGAVRISYPAENLHTRVRNNWLALGLLSGVVLGAVAVVGSLLARSVTQPLRTVEQAAATLAAGNLQARAPTDVGPPESRRLAQEFNDMAVRLGALIGAQRTFVADASHELRTPLTALRLRIENLEFAQPESLPGEVEILSNEIGRLARLVEGLLSLARAEGQRPERETINLDEELAQRIDAWEAFASEQSIILSGPEPSRLHVSVVKGAFSQMIDNYLANALEVAPGGSTIRVRLDHSSTAATVHVVDQGPGMADHERGRAFDRFWRAPGSIPGRGSGLGLAIVRQLAEASGGSAQLDRAPEGGIDATFTLMIANEAQVR